MVGRTPSNLLLDGVMWLGSTWIALCKATAFLTLSSASHVAPCRPRWPNSNTGECISLFAPTNVLVAVPKALHAQCTHVVKVCVPRNSKAHTTCRGYLRWR